MRLGNKLVAVEIPRFPLVKLTYSDGFEAVLDFAEKNSWGDAMAPLRDPAVFQSAHVGSDGISLEWIAPDGNEIDFCAEARAQNAAE
jgi:hypothetical protein